MTRNDALALIKALRHVINDTPEDPTEWANQVCWHLDMASDTLEFPKAAHPQVGMRAADAELHRHD